MTLVRRVVFWLMTLAVILGAYLTAPRDEHAVPREYAAVVPPGNLDSSEMIAYIRTLSR